MAHAVERRGAYGVLARGSEGKRPLGRPRRRWKDNIKVDFLEWDGKTWTECIWLRLGTGGGLL